MASNNNNNTPDSASGPREEQHGEATTDAARTLLNKLTLLQKQIQEERVESIKEKLQRNGKNLQWQLSVVMSAVSRSDSLQTEENTIQMLSSRIDHPLSKFNGFPRGLGEDDHINNQYVLFAKSIKIPYIGRLPPVTFWIHLARNQRMAEDDSVVGKRNIYYDQHGGETLICSDTDEELKEQEEVKHDFSQGEDQVLWMAFEDHGLTEEVLSIVRRFVGATNSEIQERYENLKEKSMGRLDQHSEDSGQSGSRTGICLDKNLSDALDTFDHLFCRQCIQIFDCPLHGCSQPLIYPSEKQPVWSEPEGDRKPCSDRCYLRLKDVKILSENSTPGSFQDKNIKIMEGLDGTLASSSAKELGNLNTRAILQKERCNYVTTPFTTEVDCHGDLHSNVPISKSTGKQKDVTNGTEFKQLSNSMEGQVDEMLSISDWKPLEKELYLKGVEMFGRNSCLIYRNLLSGLKTCMEIASYMYAGEVSMPHRSILSSIMDKNGKIDAKCTDHEMPSRSRSLRKRGKPRKFKYSSKSAGLPSMWKRIADGKNQTYKQYTPCGCQGMCGKECPCLLNGSCCEKYCGCSKLCRNRFRGCHCAKSQCRSRQCPCFAAGRECDPDVCRNCWVSCGDGSLGEPPRRGDGQCGNMRLLLRQKQRILLAKSDVAGWGAFLKNPANKNDYLGEYTGELVSQIEAEKRGKMYDRADFSFLFNLNDQYVLDAYRKGDKLKFANHSSKPNCYAKVMLVGGDHRVGIFAKECIEAGEELFYDYHYGPEHKPAWIRKLLGEDSKRDESTISKGKAKKHQSH